MSGAFSIMAISTIGVIVAVFVAAAGPASATNSYFFGFSERMAGIAGPRLCDVGRNPVEAPPPVNIDGAKQLTTGPTVRDHRPCNPAVQPCHRLSWPAIRVY